MEPVVTNPLSPPLTRTLVHYDHLLCMRKNGRFDATKIEEFDEIPSAVMPLRSSVDVLFLGQARVV